MLQNSSPKMALVTSTVEGYDHKFARIFQIVMHLSFPDGVMSFVVHCFGKVVT